MRFEDEVEVDMSSNLGDGDGPARDAGLEVAPGARDKDFGA